jgi:hypothetical protein
MEDEPVNVDLYREASDALNEAISEIERLRSDADLNQGHPTHCAMPLQKLNGCDRKLPIANTPRLTEV